MKVVVVGNAGQASAWAVALRRSGNHKVSIVSPAAALKINADLFVIGPPEPLIDGLADELRSQDKRVFGPGKDGAMLEASKPEMKRFAIAAGVSTAEFSACESSAEANQAIRYLNGNCAIKTPDPQLGKGVAVFYGPSDIESAMANASKKLQDGKQVIIEQRLEGVEFSWFVICDGHQWVFCGSARDYKRLRDGDQGPNTGGMGSISPAPGVEAQWKRWMAEHAVQPTIDELQRCHIDYRGIIYFGMIVAPNETPKLLEYNVRFGDPEAQAVFPRLAAECDLAEIIRQAADGNLVDCPTFSDQVAVTVVMAAEGYAEEDKTLRIGDPIHGLKTVGSLPSVEVYMANVLWDDANEVILTGGGRVLDVTGLGANTKAAHERAYAGVDCISWPGMQYRTDIAAGL